jgi:hypothetical protein
MAPVKHRLVTIGDSLTQGFMSGAIHRPDIAFPSMVARALGVADSFVTPDFHGAGGLPVNLERVLRTLSDRFGSRINPFELPFAARMAQELLEETEDYWERGRGSMSIPGAALPHNLAIWGYELGDASSITPRLCDGLVASATDSLLPSVPEHAMYRTARRVLNCAGLADAMDLTQIGAARRLASLGGIENLFVFLGANNCLGTVASLSIHRSEEADLTRLRPRRGANLYRPEHFAKLFERFATDVQSVGAERIFIATIPQVTIPPVSRGVPADSRDANGYYDFYTRPWIWDDSFDAGKHPCLTRRDAREIDDTISVYNETIRKIAELRGWIVVDTAALLASFAFRRAGGNPNGVFPEGLRAALLKRRETAHLVNGQQIQLDTRFVSSDRGRLAKGGLFSLDGIHPTTIGYALIADLLLREMAAVGVAVDRGLDWDAIVAADALVNKPPALLESLRDALGLLDTCGLLSLVMQEFV